MNATRMLRAGALAVAAALAPAAALAQAIPLTPPAQVFVSAPLAVPPPGAAYVPIQLQQTYSAVNRAQITNPAVGNAAGYGYYEALNRYRTGDILGAQNAATRARALAGEAPLVSPGPVIVPATPSTTHETLPQFPPNALRMPHDNGPYVPAQPLMAEDPTDAKLALVRRDIAIARTRTDTSGAEAAYAAALARRRAGDEAGAAKAADRALDVVRGELSR